MATIKILKNGLDITNIKSSKYDELLKKELSKLVFENNCFKKFNGEFSFQITGKNMAYVYLGNDAINQDFSILHQLIDEIVMRLNLQLVEVFSNNKVS